MWSWTSRTPPDEQPRLRVHRRDRALAVRISDNGEFLHHNQDTVADHGVVNVSHECINLSPDSARAYDDSAIYGDPVQVTGTSVPLSAADGDITDWATLGSNG